MKWRERIRLALLSHTEGLCRKCQQLHDIDWDAPPLQVHYDRQADVLTINGLRFGGSSAC